MAEQDRPNNGAILGNVIVIVVAIVVVTVGVFEYVKYELRGEVTHKMVTSESSSLRSLRATEQEKLSRYQWVDEKAGVVRIPVDRAIDLTVKDWPKRPTRSKPKAEAPAPAPAPEGGADGASEKAPEGAEKAPAGEKAPEKAPAAGGQEDQKAPAPGQAEGKPAPQPGGQKAPSAPDAP